MSFPYPYLSGGAFDVGEAVLELDLVGTERVLEQPGRFVFADCRPVGRHTAPPDDRATVRQPAEGRLVAPS